MLKIHDKIHYCGIVLNKNKVIFVHRLADKNKEWEKKAEGRTRMRATGNSYK